MASYIESKQKLDWQMAFNRVGDFPLDRSSMLSSLADAKKYAAGKASDPDSRKLYGTSYIGQSLVVYENDVVKLYTIQANRTLKEIADADTVAAITARLTAEESTRSSADNVLSNNIDRLWDDVKGGVNYKGHVKTVRKPATTASEISSYTLAQLFGRFYDPNVESKYISADPNTQDYVFVSSFTLNNGWMYCVQISDYWPEGSGKYITRDEIDLTDRDYIIIHDHNLSGVQLSDISRENIDIIETQDDDYVRFPLLNSISTLLSSNDIYLSGKLDALEAKTSANDNYLSNEVSTTVYVKNGTLESNKLSVIGVGVDEFSQLVASGSQLIDNQLYVLSADYVEVFGQQIKHVANPSDLSDATNKTYVDNIAANSIAGLSSTVSSLYVHKSGDSDIGTLALTGMLSTISDIVANGSLSATSSIKVGDDISSISIFPKKLVTSVKDLNTDTVSIYEFGFPQKSGTIALSSDVYGLSVALSNDIQSLSIALSDDVVLSVQDLSGQIARNDADIEFLSNGLSTLEHQHYNGTLSSIDRVGDEQHISSDNLIITDPNEDKQSHVHQKFYLTYDYGTMVLKKF